MTRRALLLTTSNTSPRACTVRTGGEPLTRPVSVSVLILVFIGRFRPVPCFMSGLGSPSVVQRSIRAVASARADERVQICRKNAIPLSGDTELPALERSGAESPPVPPRPLRVVVDACSLPFGYLRGVLPAVLAPATALLLCGIALAASPRLQGWALLKESPVQPGLHRTPNRIPVLRSRDRALQRREGRLHPAFGRLPRRPVLRHDVDIGVA